jgi:hypothetical protein
VSLKEALSLKNEALKAKLSKARRSKASHQSVASKLCTKALPQSIASKRRRTKQSKKQKVWLEALHNKVLRKV